MIEKNKVNSLANLDVKESNLKIALISLKQEDSERFPPFGLVYIASYLRDKRKIPGENIKIIDENFMNIEKELEIFKPDLIGFGSMTVNYKKIIRKAYELKSKFKVPFILGGVHISSLPESLDRVFEVGVMGEGEEILSELIDVYKKEQKFTEKNLRKVKGIVYWNSEKIKINLARPPIKNIDNLPIPDFTLVNRNYFKREEIPAISDTGIKCFLLSSRGCPYRCVFCSTSRFWGRMRFHSPDFTARIIKHFIDNFGADHIRVMDDLFTVSVERLREIKIALDKYGLMEKIKSMECQPRANLMTPELCEAMKALKIKTINFGFESGSERILKWLKQESVTVEMNRQAIILGRRYGFNIYGSLMYGSPGETIEDMKKTNEFVDFAIANKAKHVWSFISTPFPGTPFWDIALERGKVGANMDWELLSHQNIENPLLLDESIDKEEFKKVFLKGRKKLRRLKIRLVRDFVLKRPLSAVERVLKEPQNIFRVIKQVLQ